MRQEFLSAKSFSPSPPEIYGNIVQMVNCTNNGVVLWTCS